MPAKTGMAFVVVQHLSPDFKSLMDELLERFTTIPVLAIEDSIQMERDHIYLLPPKKEIVIEWDRLVVYARPNDKLLNLPINVFFQSMAQEIGSRAVAIVLSGTGSDGSEGVVAVREASGIVLVQSPESCRFDGMPLNAIATGCVDAVLRPEDMPNMLMAIGRNRKEALQDEIVDGEETDNQLQPIFNLLRATYLNDFSHYKPGTVLRRIQRRTALHHDSMDLAQYTELLRRDQTEVSALFRDLLIGVTSFFRDREAFTALRRSAIPDLLNSCKDEEELRLWVCACSTGEEAYSMAITLLEECQERGVNIPIKMFATDLHAGSLQVAADGIYSASALENVPLEYRKKYFTPFDKQSYKVVPSLRKMIIFSEHNLLKNPPFTRIHMVSCRNLLIYFKTAPQVTALSAINFSLNRGGVLFLGASETPGPLATDFEVLDRQWKIFRKARESRPKIPVTSSSSPFARLTSIETSKGRDNRNLVLTRLYNNILDRYIPAGFLLDSQHELLHVFGDAHRYMKPPSGRVTGEVYALLGRSLSMALTTALRNISEQPGRMTYRGIRLDDSDELVELSVETMFDRVSNATFYMILVKPQIEESSAQVEKVKHVDYSLTEETAEYVKQLQTELQRAKETLQTSAEELETSNEELQASNEELLASNEELQSTNEELHSVNEELYTVNTEHEHKIFELDKISTDLRNLVNSTDAAMLFLDYNLTIQIFTPLVTEIFGLLSHDVGRDIRHFMSNIPDPDLLADLEKVRLKQGQIARTLATNWPEKRFVQRTCKQSVMTPTDIEPRVIVTYVDVTETVVNRFKLSALSAILSHYGPKRLLWISDDTGKVLSVVGDRKWQDQCGLSEGSEVNAWIKSRAVSEGAMSELEQSVWDSNVCRIEFKRTEGAEYQTTVQLGYFNDGLVHGLIGFVEFE